MKTNRLIIGFILFASALITTNAQALDREELIEARQGLMTLYGVNMDILGDMIRDKRPYDKKVAQMAADNLLALASMKNGPWSCVAVAETACKRF